MIRIRKSKESGDQCECDEPCDSCTEPKSDSFFAGAFPGKPWKRLTNIRYNKGVAVKVLNSEEQGRAVRAAQQHFAYRGKDFPGARAAIQGALDDPSSVLARDFFARAQFLEKRLVVRAYLSDADGRFISHDAALPLLRKFAEAGLDFEVGAVDNIIEGKTRTEIVVGDGTEVISDKGYWYAHTHPAKSGITNNILPSTADMDVIITTARSAALNLGKVEMRNYILRDIGASRVTLRSEIAGQPPSVTIDEVLIEYFFAGGKDERIDAHLASLTSHLRMRHRLAAEQVLVRRLGSMDEALT